MSDLVGGQAVGKYNFMMHLLGTLLFYNLGKVNIWNKQYSNICFVWSICRIVLKLVYDREIVFMSYITWIC